MEFVMRYFEKIAGERVFLSPMNPEDYELYTKWLNDPAVTVNLGNYAQVFSLPREREVLEKLARDGYNFAIVLREGERPIGNISLMDVDQTNGRATVGVFIGEACDRGKGYGAEALRLLLGYGFNALRLHSINLHVHSDNPRAVACYKKAGLKECGRRRECCFVGGQYVDSIQMDILDREFWAQ
jgi:RimJ/RimL family protein N-acetyltransferase